MQKLGKEKILSYSIWDEFDKYIIDYFFDGITVSDDLSSV